MVSATRKPRDVWAARDSHYHAAVSLPPDFAWFPDTHCAGKFCLRIGGLYGAEVAIVREREGNAGWVTTTNRHRDEWSERGDAVLPTQALALRMANRWAKFHEERLRAEVKAKQERSSNWGINYTPS